jgi:hypothetical protein
MVIDMPLHDHLQHVVLGVVHDADQRQPFDRDLVSERNSRDLDFDAFAGQQHLRHRIEKRMPSLFLELLGSHSVWSLRSAPTVQCLHRRAETGS